MAPAVDIATANALYTFSLPESSRADYVAMPKPVLLAFPSLLFLIYGASIAFRTIWLHQKVTVFEIVQAAISFVLAGIGWFCFAPGAGITAFGVFCWLLAAACYTATFVCFNRGELRNYRVYAAWSAALVLAGSFLHPATAAGSPAVGRWCCSGDRGWRKSTAIDAGIPRVRISDCCRVRLRTAAIRWAGDGWDAAQRSCRDGLDRRWVCDSLLRLRQPL